jgi:putative transposase
MTTLRHFDNLGTARFITFSCFRRFEYLTNKASCQAVVDELLFLRENHGVKLLGFVFMPDHVHLVLLPPDGLQLGRAIGQLKGRSSQRILSLWEDVCELPVRPNGMPAVWERRCYDHNCRTPEIAIEKINYCHKNPVHKGLVNTPEDWKWSSCRSYMGRSDAVFEIDRVEI